MRNPFYHRQAVSDPAQVFGRAALVRELFEMVASGQSCAVVGERRIGKSTLLAYLASPTVQADHGLDPDLLLTGILDFLALHGLSPDELWPEILEALSLDAVEPEVRQQLEAQAEAGELRFADFRRTLRRLRRRGYRVALLCDELDLAVNNPQFDEAFFGALRSLAGEGVVFVTASRASLLELEQYRSEEARRKVLASPFFNIFAEFQLGPFEDHEVAEWLAASLCDSPIRFDAHDVTWLDLRAGRHPFFLQLAAYHLFGELERTGLGRVEHPRPEASGRASDRGVRRQAARKAASERVRREAAKVFRYQWRHGRDDERSVLATLARTTSREDPWTHLAGGARERTLRRLERRGLVCASEAGRRRRHRIFSVLFLDWLRTRPSVQRADPDVAPRAAPDGFPSIPTEAGAFTSALADPELDTLPFPGLPPPSAPDADERYQVLEELGHGGTARVFKAWDTQLERLVALKLLDAELRRSPGRLEALLEEARACAGLRHPHVVIVHDIDAERGFLVEEFLPGGSLRDLFEQELRLTPGELRQLATQLASALEATHAAGLVHGDLKPDNVLLVERPSLPDATEGRRRLPDVKLTDFGAALRSGVTPPPGSACPLAMGALASGPLATGTLATGTLAYMAPEQLAGRALTPASDVFAFGVLLFEARHGERPTDGATLVAPTEPDPFDQLLLACLSPEPAARPQGGAALASSLRELD